MTDERPELLAPEVVARQRSGNGWERALWIVGVLLLVISAVLVYGFVKLVFAQTSNIQSDSDISGLVAFTQASSIYTPGFVTGGIVCIALALFSRALDANSRRREALRSIPTQFPVPAAVASSGEATTVPVAPPAPAAPPLRASTDYTAFMRPPDDAADPKR
jgi:hypothetical protein